MPTPAEIAAAWHSVADRWFVRRNKMNQPGELLEVVHDWGGDLVSDNTMKVLKKFAWMEDAESFAEECEDEARGAAVLAIFNN